ncbi:BCCT family transporter [Halodesulfovibrio aestuarii]|uniref:BCCT family transporter n=1 Tax=Halodesulfovibrio aestuarii TaxID=126333 RepID=UPI00041DBEDE
MVTEDKNQGANLRPDNKILIPATIILIGIIACSILFTEPFEQLLKSVYSVFTNTTGTLFLWATLVMMFLSVFFMFSRYGEIKFGEKDEKPEFNNYSWISMMFCSGVAGAVMFWSIVEPLFNLAYPPMFAEPLSREAFEWSMAYVLLHWGPVTWPWYMVSALPICYLYYKRKKPVLRISSTAEPILGEKANSGIGRGIEIIFIIGLMFSNATVMGVSVPIVNHALSAVLGIKPSFTLELVILGISAVIFTASVSLGLKKGIKVLSDANVVIALGLVLFCFVTGPTVFIVDNFTNSMGQMLSNFWGMILWTDPYTKGSFPQDWTIFYALWMASYGPFMGLFIARISRGRTVRQVIALGLAGGIAGSYMIHAVFGGYTLHAQLNGVVDAVDMLKASGGSAALVSVLSTLPAGTFVLIGYCVFSTIFLATSVDSCAYIISCSATTKLVPGTEPTRGHRFYWAAIQAGLALAAITLGGLGPAKVFANFAGALMLVPIAFGIASWFKMTKQDDALVKYCTPDPNKTI